jgi:hypothetical protein
MIFEDFAFVTVKITCSGILLCAAWDVSAEGLFFVLRTNSKQAVKQILAVYLLAWLFDPETGSSTSLWNVGKLPLNYTASLRIRLCFSESMGYIHTTTANERNTCLNQWHRSWCHQRSNIFCFHLTSVIHAPEGNRNPSSVRLTTLSTRVRFKQHLKFARQSKIRGKVSKQITNGSKTAVMDVIDFRCITLGSSTVQLHNSLGSRHACACSEGGFSRQKGDRAWGVNYRWE